MTTEGISGELWTGVELKLESGRYFLEQMGRSLATADTEWQRPFYANFDAFLAMTRSVPDIIQWCFGKDPLHPKSWSEALAAEEQTRRKSFSLTFNPHYRGFKLLELSTARNITLHRVGYAPVEVRVTGFWGVSYIGSPIERVPATDTRPANPADDPNDPAVQWAATQPPRALHPKASDFLINGKPLADQCTKHIQSAGDLLAQARIICDQIHGGKTVTAAP